MKLSGKVAIVTGGGSGMGQEAAKLFAREGAKITVIDRDAAGARATVEAILAAGDEAIAIDGDVTDPADVEHAIAATIAAHGPPTVLFNNAGVDTEDNRLLHKVPDEAFDRVIAVNLKGPWLMMKAVIPLMIEAGGGTIVNNASIGAFVAGSTAGYCASKGGLVSLSRAAAVQYGRYNIRVNTLCPGATRSALADQMLAEMQAKGLVDAGVVDRMSVLGRMADPLEQAKAALFLACDDSSYVTGIPLIVDGGWTSMSGVPTAA